MIVARQHENDPWRPAMPWPERCTVQWGAHGVVFRRSGGCYATAFFEAFPADETVGSFIRGEGPDVESAEIDAFDQMTRQMSCAHAWSRGSYTNGGATCRRCKAFRMVHRPIVTLGEWSRPVTVEDVEDALMGTILPRPADFVDVQMTRYRRRIWLQLVRAGIDLPPPPDEPVVSWRGDPVWKARAMEAVRDWVDRTGGIPGLRLAEMDESQIDRRRLLGMFDG